MQDGRPWGKCFSGLASAGCSLPGLLPALNVVKQGAWCSHSISVYFAKTMAGTRYICASDICSQVGRRAGPVAVLRPPLKALALGHAVDVDGAPDAAAALVQPLPRRRVLLQRTGHHVHVVSLCCPGSHRKHSSVTITITDRSGDGCFVPGAPAAHRCRTWTTFRGSRASDRPCPTEPSITLRTCMVQRKGCRRQVCVRCM